VTIRGSQIMDDTTSKDIEAIEDLHRRDVAAMKASSLSQITCRYRSLFADISQNDIFGKETANEEVYS